MAGETIALADACEADGSRIRSARSAMEGRTAERYFDHARRSCVGRGVVAAYTMEGPNRLVSGRHIAFGAIRFPATASPSSQMADRAPTGGYPNRHGDRRRSRPPRQMRAGATSPSPQFPWTRRSRLWRSAREAMFAALSANDSATLSSEELLARNLIGGVVSLTNEGEGGRR